MPTATPRDPHAIVTATLAAVPVEQTALRADLKRVLDSLEWAPPEMRAFHLRSAADVLAVHIPVGAPSEPWHAAVKAAWFGEGR
jgi:hypothetical protein